MQPERYQHKEFSTNIAMTSHIDLQAEFRAKTSQQVKASPTLATRFLTLTSLAVDLTFHNTLIPAYDSRIKYIVNLANAKSVFRIPCSNGDCFRGDFDLTDALAKAVANHQKSASGELTCPGWSSMCMISKFQCHNVLRYALMLGY